LGFDGAVRRKWKLMSIAEEEYMIEGSRRRTLERDEMRRSGISGVNWSIDSMSWIVENWN
jgi:hypothetical protein